MPPTPLITRSRTERRSHPPSLPPKSPGGNPENPPDYLVQSVDNQDLFRISVADTQEKQGQALHLIRQMYERRGYRHSHFLPNTPHTITLIATGTGDTPIGTLTIGLESPAGLLAERTYPGEIESMRVEGKRICEFIGLAVVPGVRSKKVLARLFHTAMLCTWGFFGHTDSVIEVTPAHARFYRRMLGFRQVGTERVCSRVNAVGVLLHIAFAWANKRIEAVGGLEDRAEKDNTLYPLFFGKDDAEEILGRMKRIQPQNPTTAVPAPGYFWTSPQTEFGFAEGCRSV